MPPTVALVSVSRRNGTRVFEWPGACNTTATSPPTSASAARRSRQPTCSPSFVRASHSSPSWLVASIGCTTVIGANASAVTCSGHCVTVSAVPASQRLRRSKRNSSRRRISRPRGASRASEAINATPSASAPAAASASGMPAAITGGLSVRERRPERLVGLAEGLVDRCRLVAAMSHAVVAARILAAAVPAPVGLLEQLAEVEIEGRVVQPPLAAPAAGERGAEQPPGLLDAGEVLLIGGLLIGVGGRDHHLVDLQLIVEEVEHLTHRLRRVIREEGGVGGHTEAAALRLADCGHRLVEHALAADGLVVALAQAVDVDGEGKVGRWLELVELALEQERLTARNRDDGGTALLDCRHRLLDRHAPAQDVVRMLDLAAARAGEVALEQRLERQHQRILLAPAQPLGEDVPADLEALTQRYAHQALTSRGGAKRTVSRATACSLI